MTRSIFRNAKRAAWGGFGSRSIFRACVPARAALLEGEEDWARSKTRERGWGGGDRLLPWRRRRQRRRSNEGTSFFAARYRGWHASLCESEAMPGQRQKKGGEDFSRLPEKGGGGCGRKPQVQKEEGKGEKNGGVRGSHYRRGKHESSRR